MESLLSALFQIDTETTEAINLYTAAVQLLEKFMHEHAQSSSSLSQQDVSWWVTMIDWYIQKAASRSSEAMYTVRSVACDAISRIPESVFAQLPVGSE